MDYQYQRAAEMCLTLLEDAETFCVFLEWHDDYVSEKRNAHGTLYGFHQVKTRTASEGPWSVAQVFGLPKAKSQPASKDSIAIKLFEHLSTFQNLCDEVVLVTNCGVKDELDSLVRECRSATSSTGLSEAAKKIFDKVVLHWTMPDGPIPGADAESIFNFIKIIKLRPEAARLQKTAEDYRSELSTLIFKFSEIDLTTSQAGAICQELLELVREKSNLVIPSTGLPSSEEELRKRKGIQVSDLLPLLSLSSDAYVELRRTGAPVVKTLSRLQRICSASNFNQEQTLLVCKLKTEWDVWYLKNRSHLSERDLELLKGECSGALDTYAKGNGKFEHLVIDAEGLAVRYAPKLKVDGLDSSLVVGFIFAIASERGVNVGTT